MAMAEATETLFDTHAHIRALTGAGMPEAQAEAVVRLQVDVLQRHIVTKADAAAIRSDTADLRSWSESEFAALRTWSEGEFRAVRSDIANLRSWTEAELASLRSWTEAEFRAVRSDIADLKTSVDALKTAKVETIKWVAGLNLTTAALVVAAIKIL